MKKMCCWIPLMILPLGSIILFLLPSTTSGLQCVWCEGVEPSAKGRNWFDDNPHDFTPEEQDAILNPKKCPDASTAPANAVITCEHWTAHPEKSHVKNWLCQVFRDWRNDSGCVDADQLNEISGNRGWAEPGKCVEDDAGIRVCFCNKNNCNASPLDYKIINGVDTSAKQDSSSNRSPGNGSKALMGVSPFGFLFTLGIIHFRSLFQLLWGQ